jgi:hypothetical protein
MLNPELFKSGLFFQYVEDETANAPMRYENIKNFIPLAAEVVGENLVLQGKPSPYKASCYDLKFNNHNYGMEFYIVCQNKDEKYKGKKLWRRVVDRKFLQQAFHEDLSELVLDGDSPDIPNCPVSQIFLELEKRSRNDYHCVNVSIQIPLTYFDLFVECHSN